jgi:glycosyltransferase involved in cell wall biosynthesis
VGGIREIIEHGDSALLVAPGDPDALGEALAALCRDPDLRQRLGHRGRAVYDERFTARLMVDRINRYYDRLTDRRTARVGT